MTGDPFSQSAPTYDEEFSALPRVRELRVRIVERFRRFVPPPARVLDIGCGTGEDAFLLLEAGYGVLAADPSAAMLSVARGKARSSGSEISFAQTGADAIGSLASGGLGAAFSNFGALNCVEDIGGFFKQLALVLPPGSRAVLVVLNRHALWECASHCARGRVAEGFRRWRAGPVDVRLKGTVCPTWYWTPGEIRRAASGEFDREFVEGLNVVSPPPGSTAFTSRFPRLARGLDKLDRTIGSCWPFSGWGDHVLIVLRRRGEGGGPCT